MKKEFSIHWRKSKQRRKQRKYLANAPLFMHHIKLSAHLSKDLRKKYGRRSFPLRKGDEVKIMRGTYKKKTGKITVVNVKKMKVAIEGIQGKKKDGAKVNLFFEPSNLMINELNLDDKRRLESLMRKIPVKKQKKVKTIKQTEEKKEEKSKRIKKIKLEGVKM